MKGLLSIVVACLALAYEPGEAQHEDFHRWFADTGRIACSSWRSPATPPPSLICFTRDGAAFGTRK